MIERIRKPSLGKYLGPFIARKIGGGDTLDNSKKGGGVRRKGNGTKLESPPEGIDHGDLVLYRMEDKEGHERHSGPDRAVQNGTESM